MLPALPLQLSERYGVIGEIDQGGHAVVFRACDRSLSRDVAVKRLREDVSFPDISAQFAQEVQLLATPQHAHILHVHDSGSYDNRPFVVMELAPVHTLSHRLEREPQLPHNRMTRTSAADYRQDGLHMNSVDTGWVTDEDVAARIVDPIVAGVSGGVHE